MDVRKYESLLSPWFAARMRDRGEDASSVKRVFPLSDGHSSITLSVDVADSAAGHEAVTFVVRTSPDGPGLLEPYDLSKQYRIMADLADSGIPLPEMLWLEEDPAVMGRTFFVMSRVEGEIIEYSIPDWMQQASDASRRSMCMQIVDTIAALHCVPAADPRFDYLRDPGECDTTGRELGGWEQLVADSWAGALPAFDALIGWLREQRPEGSNQLTLLHGDLKWGNFVFDHDRLVALLDWEMAAVGDPLVDVGYALMSWENSPAALPGGLTRDEFIARYEERTGIPVVDIAWYENLNALKLAAILLRGISLFERGESHDLRYSWMGTALPMLVNPALERAGIDDVVQAPINPTPANVAASIQRMIHESIAPALREDAAVDLTVLSMAVQSLADAATGQQFAVGRVPAASSSAGPDT